MVVSTLQLAHSLHVLPLHVLPGGDVVHAHKHWPCAMCAALVAERIDSIGARDQHYVPWILPKVLLEVQCLPLGPIRRVTQHPIFFWIIFFSFFFLLLPFRMPAHELSLLRVREITLQTRNDQKVPHHFLGAFRLVVSTGAALRTYGRLRV